MPSLWPCGIARWVGKQLLDLFFGKEEPFEYESVTRPRVGIGCARCEKWVCECQT